MQGSEAVQEIPACRVIRCLLIILVVHVLFCVDDRILVRIKSWREKSQSRR